MTSAGLPPNTAVTNDFVDEITRLLRQRSLADVSVTRTSRLDLLAGVTVDSASADRCTAIGRLLEICARSIGDPDLSRAALALVERLGEFRPEKDRGRSAGSKLGVSYHAFRRRDTSGVSHRDRVILALARQLAAEVLPKSNRFGSGSSSRLLMFGMTIAITVLVVVMSVSRISNQRSNSGQTAATIEPVPAISGFAISAAAVAGSSDTAEVVGLDVFAGDPVSGDIERSCDVDPGEVGDLSGPNADDASAEFALAYALRGGREEMGCPSEPMRFGGGIYWQSLARGHSPNGGLLGGEGHDVQILNSGQWISYNQVGDILGGIDAAPVRAGIPESEAVFTSDGWVLPLSPEGAMIAESEDGHYVWVSSPVATLWEQSGGSTGEFGLPMTDHSFGAEGLRQDFTNGYVTVSAGGTVDWHRVHDRKLGLPSDDEVRGRILEVSDGTSWFIDNELHRWWVRDPQILECVGGSANIESRNVAGYSIAAYDYAGSVACPSSKSGVFPRGGVASIGIYCGSNVSIRSKAVVADDGVSGCSDGKRLQPVDIDSVCTWQYGPSSYPWIDESNPSVPRCAS